MPLVPRWVPGRVCQRKGSTFTRAHSQLCVLMGNAVWSVKLRVPRTSSAWAGRNTYSRARLLIREVVERRVAAGERLGISPDVRVGRVLIEAGPSVAALAAGLAQFGIAPTDVAVGFEGDLSAEHAQHKQIKFGLAAARFWARVQRSSDEGCWNWSGPVDDDGFGFVHMRQWGVRSRM